MNNQTPYDQLRQLLVERLPHLKELSFGCEVRDKVGLRGTYLCDLSGASNKVYAELGTVNNYDSYDYKIIGHPPTLQDVLLAINQTVYKHINIDSFGSIWDNGINSDEDFVIRYDLTKSLKDQSDETLLAVVSLLDKNETD